MDWKVGQEVYVVPFDKRSQPQSATITKIARKWMDLEPSWVGPISKEDGTVKPQAGLMPRAKAWPSKEAYEEHEKLNEIWRGIVQRMGHNRPPHIGEEGLAKILEVLNAFAN